MLAISSLKDFCYSPSFHDMRYKAPRVSEIIRFCHHRAYLSDDVYIPMSKG